MFSGAFSRKYLCLDKNHKNPHFGMGRTISPYKIQGNYFSLWASSQIKISPLHLCLLQSHHILREQKHRLFKPKKQPLPGHMSPIGPMGRIGNGPNEPISYWASEGHTPPSLRATSSNLEEEPYFPDLKQLNVFPPLRGGGRGWGSWGAAFLVDLAK